jgi:lipopolysaccharide biosynthesis glycosyltransferase
VGPIRVFIGGSPEERIPAKVLEASIRRNTSRRIECTFLSDVDISIPTPKLRKNRARTPFSFQRFLIPELCNYSGRAIYLDSDMLVFADINELWEFEMNSCDLVNVGSANANRTPQYSVLLLQCAGLNWSIANVVSALDSGIYSYEKLMNQMCIVPRQLPSLPESWNSLESYEKNETNLLHYTDMNRQPWTTRSSRFEQLWIDALHQTIASGALAREELKSAIQLGHVRPSLKHIVDGIKLTDVETRKLDANFKPPFKRIKLGQRSFVNRLFDLLK